MLNFSTDLFVDALTLLLRARNEQVLLLIKSLLDIYRQEENKIAIGENEVFDFYIHLIQEIIDRNISRENPQEMESFILKFSSAAISRTNPDFFTPLKKIFTNTEELPNDQYKYLVRKLMNHVVWYYDTNVVKKMFARLCSAPVNASVSEQEARLQELTNLCEDIIRANQSRIGNDEENHKARRVDFTSLEEIKHAMTVYEDIAVTNIFRTGWQGMNRTFGSKLGFPLGSSIVINGSLHSCKSLSLLHFVRWCVTLNAPPAGFSNPTCVLYSLENETPQNLMMLFKMMYCNKYKQLPPKDICIAEMANFCYETVRANGWKLIIDRRHGESFGYAELVADFQRLKSLGYTPLMVVIDYMNLMKKGTSDRDGSWIHLRELYTNVVNFLKMENCCLITAHQLNRKASETIRMNPINAVQRFTNDMLADGLDPQRTVDIAFFINKEVNQHGDAYYTAKQSKMRYVDDVKESDKYFAYRFHGELGLLDDIDGPDMSLKNIYADKFRGDKKDNREENDFLTATSGLFG